MRRGAALAPLALAVALLASCAGSTVSGGAAAPPTSRPSPSTSGAAATATSTTVPGASDALEAFQGARDHRSVAPPVAVHVPAIGVDAPLDPLGRNPDGTIQLPAWGRAGWWAGGPKPGQPGPAVILGHVDSPDGPAVFRRLGELGAGDEVAVTLADGSTVRFAVERVERHPKTAFPTEAVYGPSLEAGLRLVTCGGEFDRATGHYVDNVVVFAAPAG